MHGPDEVHIDILMSNHESLFIHRKRESRRRRWASDVGHLECLFLLYPSVCFSSVVFVDVWRRLVFSFGFSIFDLHFIAEVYVIVVARSRLSMDRYRRDGVRASE